MPQEELGDVAMRMDLRAPDGWMDDWNLQLINSFFNTLHLLILAMFERKAINSFLRKGPMSIFCFYNLVIIIIVVVDTKCRH